jgi:Recombinase zinc beta ribbon domain
LLLGRQTKLKGRKGVGVANMFTGKVFCGTCGAAMRVDTGGHASKTGIRQRKLQCSRFIETRTCSDGTRYNLHYFEPLILDKIIELSALVPRTADTDHQAGAKRLAELQVRVAMLEESIGTLAPRIGVSAALASQVEKMSIELDGLRRKADIMVLEQQAATSSNTRHVDTWKFIRAQVGPALRGNVEARERVRGLLARVAFQIGGWDTPPGSLALEIGEHTEVIEPAGLRFTVEAG